MKIFSISWPCCSHFSELHLHFAALTGQNIGFSLDLVSQKSLLVGCLTLLVVPGPSPLFRLSVHLLLTRRVDTRLILENQ